MDARLRHKYIAARINGSAIYCGRHTYIAAGTHILRHTYIAAHAISQHTYVAAQLCRGTVMSRHTYIAAQVRCGAHKWQRDILRRTLYRAMIHCDAHYIAACINGRMITCGMHILWHDKLRHDKLRHAYVAACIYFGTPISRHAYIPEQLPHSTLRDRYVAAWLHCRGLVPVQPTWRHAHILTTIWTGILRRGHVGRHR